ncbi:META domain-containing protein [Pseudoroseomonas cervicalis]|uniref:META domain-containing protein n=1 Tax=Teichococcus cervicalis TaxID=204525 RepID=UPI002782DFBC|nr:META domain-containing protein [Pseudoroseomonas cervicalis]MDQ1078525.1 heat shock protein HslJ [Pseudoroseomonas cervicalis]
MEQQRKKRIRGGVLGAGLLALLAGCASGSGDMASPLAGNWRLESLGGVGIRNEGPRAAAVEFGPQGRLMGSGGCNRIAGSYTQSGSRLTIGPVAATRMACIDPVATQNETAFLAALQNVASFRYDAGRLFLLDAQGQALASLTGP